MGVKHILECIYNRHFELQNLKELQILARLADFYGALPTALCLAMIAEILENPVGFFEAAYRLRNASLYRESMVQVAAQWNGQGLIHYPEPEIEQLSPTLAYLPNLTVRIRQSRRSLEDRLMDWWS